MPTPARHSCSCRRLRKARTPIRFAGSYARPLPAVALAIPSPRATDDDYELAALGWAVEHAAELGAHPEQVMVAGEGAGGARAARLAIRARDTGWPQLRRQILVYPTFTQTCPMPSLLTGVAPATVISSDTRIDDGSTYAARLRASDIEVDVLRYSPPILPGHDTLSAALAGRNGMRKIVACLFCSVDGVVGEPADWLAMSDDLAAIRRGAERVH